MVERLRENTELLREHMQRVQDGDRRYLGEVAGKIRLLAIETRSNKALMLRLGKLVGGTAYVTIGGPPGWTYLDGHTAGDRIPFEEWLGTFQFGARTASSPDQPQQMSKREFVLAWAQQSGGSHEDWSVDERLEAGRAYGQLMRSMLGIDVMARALMDIAAVVLLRAQDLLAHMTPDVIAQAEKAHGTR